MEEEKQEEVKEKGRERERERERESFWPSTHCFVYIHDVNIN